MSAGPARWRPWRRAAVLSLVAAALAVSLGACGKRGKLEAPPGEESRYTYPRAYPDPASVLPPETGEATPRSREAPSHAGDISPIPSGRRTTTYGQPPVQ